MNWCKFKDPVSHMCLAGAVVAFWSLIHEMAISSPFTVMTNSMKTFKENSIISFRHASLLSCSIQLYLSNMTIKNKKRQLFCILTAYCTKEEDHLLV